MTDEQWRSLLAISQKLQQGAMVFRQLREKDPDDFDVDKIYEVQGYAAYHDANRLSEETPGLDDDLVAAEFAWLSNVYDLYEFQRGRRPTNPWAKYMPPESPGLGLSEGVTRYFPYLASSFSVAGHEDLAERLQQYSSRDPLPDPLPVDLVEIIQRGVDLRIDTALHIAIGLRILRLLGRVQEITITSHHVVTAMELVDAYVRTECEKRRPAEDSIEVPGVELLEASQRFVIGIEGVVFPVMLLAEVRDLIEIAIEIRWSQDLPRTDAPQAGDLNWRVAEHLSALAVDFENAGEPEIGERFRHGDLRAECTRDYLPDDLEDALSLGMSLDLSLAFRVEQERLLVEFVQYETRLPNTEESASKVDELLAIHRRSIAADTRGDAAAEREAFAEFDRALEPIRAAVPVLPLMDFLQSMRAVRIEAAASAVTLRMKNRA